MAKIDNFDKICKAICDFKVVDKGNLFDNRIPLGNGFYLEYGVRCTDVPCDAKYDAFTAHMFLCHEWSEDPCHCVFMGEASLPKRFTAYDLHDALHDIAHEAQYHSDDSDRIENYRFKPLAG